MTSQTDPTPLLVDAHVHLHDCFELVSFLDAAITNFKAQNHQQDTTEPVTGALLLSEVSGVDAFTKRVKAYANTSVSDWEICPTQETYSCWARHADGHSILIAAGRQVVTTEGIEVLALITEKLIPDGLSIEDTIKQVVVAGGLPVVPWGVGKWIGKRGNLVEHQLRTSEAQLFAGDNGGRPGFWSLPAYFQQRAQLPGTDPLPLPEEVSRAGSYGFFTQGTLDEETPGQSLKQILQDPDVSIAPYGRSLPPLKFIKNQALIRMR